MGYKIDYHPLAEYDLIGIGDHLSQFYKSTLKNFMEDFEEKISYLKDMPRMGTTYRSFRKLVISDYLVFYKVIEDEKRIRIYRIIHGTQDSEIQNIE